MYKDLTGMYYIVTIGQTASMSMLTFYESRYTCTPIDLIKLFECRIYVAGNYNFVLSL